LSYQNSVLDLYIELQCICITIIIIKIYYHQNVSSNTTGMLQVCLCSEKERLHSRIIVQTPISEFLKLILN